MTLTTTAATSEIPTVRMPAARTFWPSTVSRPSREREGAGVDRRRHAVAEAAEDVPAHADGGGNEHEEAGVLAEGAGDRAEEGAGQQARARVEGQRDQRLAGVGPERRAEPCGQPRATHGRPFFLGRMVGHVMPPDRRRRRRVGGARRRVRHRRRTNAAPAAAGSDGADVEHAGRRRIGVVGADGSGRARYDAGAGGLVLSSPDFVDGGALPARYAACGGDNVSPAAAVVGRPRRHGRAGARHGRPGRARRSVRALGGRGDVAGAGRPRTRRRSRGRGRGAQRHVGVRMVRSVPARR